MRVLHAALLHGSEPGISRQMKWEHEAANTLQQLWDTRPFGPTTPSGKYGPLFPAWEPSPSEPVGRLRRASASLIARKSFYDWVTRQSRNYDVVMLRHTPHDPFRAAAVERITSTVVSVHHTLEGHELRTLGGIAGASRERVEHACGRRSLSRSDVVVGVTQEIVDYELSRIGRVKPSFVYPNGCVVTSEDVAAVSNDRRSRKPELLFLSSNFDPWHGLDRLLASLQETREDFVLNLVGRMDERDELAASRDPRVQIHGILTPPQIRRIAARCWAGLSSFALDRKGMRQACPLKVREYLRYGLPVFAGHPDVFPEQASFFQQGTADMNQILDFAMQMRGTPPQTTLHEALPFIDKRELLKTLSSNLESTLVQLHG